MFLRAALWALSGTQLDYELSAPAGVGVSVPPPPAVAPPVATPTPTPTARPTPAATRTGSGAAPAQPAPPAPANPSTPKPRMLSPYPLIRISGRLTLTGAHVTRLTVTAPRGARITVVCRGAGCPVQRLARTASVTHLRVFERDLRAGTRLTITISKPGFITKVTTITIRRGRPPTRTDLCVAPDARRASACPKP
jgi:hypothetical protein